MSRVGRNAPCPCGSGRKHKLCCGRQVAPSESIVDGTHLRLRVTLRHSDPPVWRRFLLRPDATFADLHAAIQTLGWDEDHLWQFTDPSRAVIAGIPNDAPLFGRPAPDARKVRLASYFKAPGTACTYTYDFGDNWEHDVVLEDFERHASVFRRALIDGAGGFPPEDCGGFPGFARLRRYVATGVDPWNDEESVKYHAQAWRGDRFDLAREQARFGAVPPDARRSPAPLPPQPTPEPARVTELTEPIVVELADEALAAARALGDALGLSIRLAGASFHGLNAKIELEVATVRDDGVVLDSRATEFLTRGTEFGFEASDLGRVFACGQETFRVVGLRPRAKLPVICEQLVHASLQAKRVRMSAASVRDHLARAAAGGSGPRLVTDELAGGAPG